MAKENLLIIYKDDFRKTSVWVDICTILEIPTDSESAYITFTNVQHEGDIQVYLKDDDHSTE